ncbi:MAG: hypothetical protein NTW29_08215 [Bacteroidetes bacterium]|nr:hypothetical protein [Bacteroidota bacterium]
MNTHIVLIDNCPIYSSGIKTSITDHTGMPVNVSTYSVSDLYGHRLSNALTAACAGIRFDTQGKGYEIRKLLLALRKYNKKIKIVAYYDTLTARTLESIARYKPAGYFQLSASPSDVGAVFKNVLLSNTRSTRKKKMVL